MKNTWVLFIFLFVVSCKPVMKRDVSAFHAERNIPVSQMRMDDVIVSVNTSALTRCQFEDRLALKEVLFKIRYPNAPVYENPGLKDAWKKSVVDEFIARQLILQEAEKRTLVPSERAKEYVKSNACLTLKVSSNKIEHKMDKLGLMGDLLRTVMYENEVMFTLRETLFKERLEVQEEEIDERINNVKLYYQRAEATNQLLRVKAQTVYEQLQNGSDFLAVANKMSDAKDNPMGVWGQFTRGELENHRLLDAASKLPVGSVSKPIEIEEGLVIIKIIERSDGFVTNLLTSTSTVKLGRILFRMMEGGEGTSLPQRDEVRAVLLGEKVVAVQNEWIASLASNALIRYPNGTNLWGVVISPKGDESKEGR